jgi:hypothetical protein
MRPRNGDVGIQLPGQALRALCRKTHLRNPRTRAPPPLTFSIPHVLRGLLERDRKLPGLLAQTAYAAILKTFRALFGRAAVSPGFVIPLLTFGAYGANFNPHAHALVSNRVFTRNGEFPLKEAKSEEWRLDGYRHTVLRCALPCASVFDPA